MLMHHIIYVRVDAGGLENEGDQTCAFSQRFHKMPLRTLRHFVKPRTPADNNSVVASRLDIDSINVLASASEP